MEKSSYTAASGGPEDTERLAAAVADLAFPGCIIGLDGDLGAGKTAFSQSFARRLGVRGVVSSPTFTIIKEYAGRLPLYHMDVYRLSPEEADELGLEEYFYGEGVCLVEWSTLIRDLMPAECLRIAIETTGPQERSITLTGYGEAHAEICRSLGENGASHDE
ncbi:tRNA (adenosine(37)-N6)-threonylcarbamoyltransferase complex ATPase subunit type 1 TsaE [Paenibacillus glufosinatiresistens]|uniref:tRNA (adenosine(37)-N6)-threonylcarbamoyltransferase complex ATPase subunit type 1 TsaE n=1 Tax=Paenibacillus glufosinatiresistens TaxID=3070657 RepID=UPI00286D8844|nr:tRNA (adenosine(37)-N6)-threonylcarbamoyltransferase complex ATPase subunit type 1 TsaE [Paenibacillus sp. YX.27]